VTLVHISEKGLRLIEQFEGFVSHPYWDPYGKVWTRGYGETEGIHSNSAAISHDEAQAKLKQLVEERYEPALREIPGLNQNQNAWDAICDFVWNVGTGAIAAGTAVGNALRAHDLRLAANAMLQWTHAGGVELPGLVVRRHADIDLLLTKTVDPLAALEPHEREEVNRYDTLLEHPHLHEHGLKIVRARLVALRKAVWHAADKDIKAGKSTNDAWETNHRRQRYNILLSRTR
jgi:lysozyme